jgi:hypothetical protein
MFRSIIDLEQDKITKRVKAFFNENKNCDNNINKIKQEHNG